MFRYSVFELAGQDAMLLSRCERILMSSEVLLEVGRNMCIETTSAMLLLKICLKLSEDAAWSCH
jgi:hypothetical protein